MTYDDLKRRFHVDECVWCVYRLPRSGRLLALHPKRVSPKGSKYIGTARGVARSSAIRHFQKRMQTTTK